MWLSIVLRKIGMRSWFLRSAISVKLAIGARTMTEFGHIRPLPNLLEFLPQDSAG